MGETQPRARVGQALRDGLDRVGRRCAAEHVRHLVDHRAAPRFGAEGRPDRRGKIAQQEIGVAVDAVKRAGMQPPDRRRISDEGAFCGLGRIAEQGTNQAAEALSEILEHDEAEFGVAAEECRSVTRRVPGREMPLPPIP